MFDYKGRYVVVTGCAQGIGKAIAKGFIDQHAEGVAMLDYNFDKLLETAKELDPELKQAFPLQCDVSNKESVHEAFEKIREKFGRIDVLVNNAGICRDAIFHKMTYEQFRAVIEVNLFGTYYCTAEAYPGMRAQEYGRIVNIGSTSAHGNVGQANYAASKGAINGFTKTLALEGARKNVTANVIEPCLIDTEMMRGVPEDILEKKIAGTPMHRLGLPTDIANIALFLGSEEAGYVSGMVVIGSGAAKII